MSETAKGFNLLSFILGGIRIEARLSGGSNIVCWGYGGGVGLVPVLLKNVLGGG
jgi:hypothetical protein